MNGLENNIKRLTEEFENCQKLFIALGDENRQCIIIEMMKMNNCSGSRVGEITERTNLSRPAVSHHLQILKDAGILKRRKEGTKNYYYFDKNTKAMDRLLDMINLAKSIMVQLPDRRKRVN